MKRLTAILLITAMLFGMGLSASAQEAHWADGYIAMLSERGLLFGDENGMRPDDPLLRSEFLHLLNEIFDIAPRPYRVYMQDVAEDAWYYEDFSAAVQQQIVSGDDTGRFRPEEPVTRVETAVLLGRVLGTSEETLSYKDRFAIPDWGRNSVAKMQTLGIMTGYEDNTFRPASFLTRAEGFVVIARTLQAQFDGGSGTADDPFLISNVYQFMRIGEAPGASYALISDLDFRIAAAQFVPTAFHGTLDGQFHKLIGVPLSNDGNAVFSAIGKDGTLKNVRLICIDARVALAHRNEGRIEACSNTSFQKTADGNESPCRGGIANVNNGVITACYNTSAILADANDQAVGGIVGQNSGTVENCFNVGKGGRYAGGVAGVNTGMLQNCFQAETQMQVVLQNRGSVRDCMGATGALLRAYTAPVWEDSGEAFPTLVQNPYYKDENYIDYSGGDGSRQNPYRIENAMQLNRVRNHADAYFLQMQDIDMALGEQGTAALSGSFLPIGTADVPFSGVYDGCGHALSNLRILSGDRAVGLFGYNEGIICRLTLQNSYIEGGRYTGSIAGINLGRVESCAFSGKVTGSTCGGIVGYNRLRNAGVRSCYQTGFVYAGKYGGGIAGENEGEIADCYQTGTVLGTVAGGIVGSNDGEVLRAYHAGTTEGETVAAIAAVSRGTVANCYAKGNAVQETGVKAILPENMRYAIYFPAFDFGTTWVISSQYAYLYPQLRGNLQMPAGAPENYTDFAGGRGTADDPYKIVTPIHLHNVRNYPNSCFLLQNDLDLAYVTSKGGIYDHDGKGFLPIERFSGIFDGGGHTILHLTIHGQERAGLFADNRGIISGVILEDAEVSGTAVGGLAAKNDGVLSGCSVDGTLEGQSCGGLAADNAGAILSCASYADVYGVWCGGVAQQNDGTIRDCLQTGRVTAQEAACGIAGGGGIAYCYTTGSQTGGQVYPVSDGEYERTFYLSFANETAPGKKSYAALKDAKTYIGFDSEYIWKIEDGELPVLRGLPGKTDVFPTDLTHGTGSADDPYLIASADDLPFLRMYPDACFRLTKSLTWTDQTPLVPIGNADIPFSGIFDGGGYQIRDLTVKGEETTGLFGYLTGQVSDLTLVDCTVEGSGSTGAIAGINAGSITRCDVRGGRVGTSGDACGGIAGKNTNDGIIQNSSSGADVFSSKYAGGIAGENDGIISDAANCGGVLTTAESDAAASGGIAGYNRNVVQTSFNVGRIFAYSDAEYAYCGGIAGENASILTNCYHTGTTVAKSTAVSYSAGLAGICRKNADISHSYSIGYPSGEGQTVFAGALTGGGNGRITECYYDVSLHPPTGDSGPELIRNTGLLPEEMQYPENYKNLNFYRNWTMEEGFGYPQLQGNRHMEVLHQENQVDFAGGNGTYENPYRIMTPEQLDHVRKFLGATYLLIGDLDMSAFCLEQPFAPIGDKVFSFFGVFLGGGHTISGLTVTSGGGQGGMFRENHGEIYQLGFRSYRSDSTQEGALASINTGLIYNCFSTASIRKETEKPLFAGGLVGVNKASGMIISSYFAGNLQMRGDSVQTGGIAYGNYGVIAGCFNSAPLRATGQRFAIGAGICAYNFGTVSDCYQASNVSVSTQGVGEAIGGGIAGTSGGSIINCYNSGKSVLAKTAGAIAANSASGSLLNCYYDEAAQIGVGIGDDTFVYAKTEEELKTRETFTDFDFESMWIMDRSFRYQYPQFIEIAHRASE